LKRETKDSPPLKSPSPLGEGIGVRLWGRGGVSDIKCGMRKAEKESPKFFDMLAH